MLKRWRDRAGFTLLEFLVALAIVALLGAVLYPTVAGQLRSAQSTALANQLDNLRQSIANYRQNVQRFPQLLTQLTTQPPGGGSFDACGTALPAANMALWRGPYLTQVFTATGMPVGDATVINLLDRNPNTTPPQPAELGITVVNVDSTSAADLERQFDGPVWNSAAGTIRWTPTAAPLGDLVFWIPIRGC